MKNTINKMLLILAFSFLFMNTSWTQSFNWQSLQKEDQHILNINTGLDYGLILGVGYAYQLNTKLPILLNAEYSFPSGDKFLDDFKTRIGGVIKLHEVKSFQFSLELHGVFRRAETGFVTLTNFGTELSGVIGFYKPKWFVAGEIGFDKAIVTNFQHTSDYKEIYAEVEDGWYKPATGGNFKYGLQVGYSFKQIDLYLKAGSLIADNFKSKPTFPVYAELGGNVKFKKRTNR